MKNFKNFKKMFAVLFAATMMFVWTGCSKEGPVGPAGPAGPAGQQGPKGDKGDIGNANVLATEWLSFRTTGDDGSEESDLGSDTRSYFAWFIYAPILNSINLSGDSASVVLVYFKESAGTNTVTLIPKIIPNLFEYSTLLTVNINKPGGNQSAYLALIFTTLGDMQTERITPNKLAPKLDNYHYRIVVVPQATTKSTGTKSLKEELENMSYLEVCERYGIEP